MPACVSYNNHPSYLCHAGLEWLLSFPSVRNPQCPSAGLHCGDSIRTLNDCVGTVVHCFRNIFACLICLFEETAFCFLFLCVKVGQTSITCSIDLKLKWAHSQVSKREGGRKNIFSPSWVFCLGSIPKPFMAHKESAAFSRVNWDQAMAETRADYRGRLSLLMSDESFQNHMIWTNVTI